MSPPVTAIEFGAFEFLFALITVPFHCCDLAESMSIRHVKATYRSLQVPDSTLHTPGETILSRSCHHRSQPFRRS